MRKFLLILTLAMLAVASVCMSAHGQTAQPSPVAAADSTANRVIGEVTAIDAAAKRLSVKTDAGASVSVMLNDKTAYMRLAPGEKTLANAVKIELANIAVGDRVLARGQVAEDHKSVPAIALIV